MDDGESKNEWKIFQRRGKRRDVGLPETGSFYRNVRDSGDVLERVASIKRTIHDSSPEYERMKKLEKIGNEKPPSQGNLKEGPYGAKDTHHSGSGRRHSAHPNQDQKDEGYLSPGDTCIRGIGDDMGKDRNSGHQDHARNTDHHRLRRVSKDREQHLGLKNGQDGRDPIVENDSQPPGRIGHGSGGSERKVLEIPSIPFHEKSPFGVQSSAKLKVKVGGVTPTLLSNGRKQPDGSRQLKVGGVIHTPLSTRGKQPDGLRLDKKGDKKFSDRTGSSLRTCSNAPGLSKPRQRLILQDNSDDEDDGFSIRPKEHSLGKDSSLSNIPKVQSNFELDGPQWESVGRMCTSKSLETSADASQPLPAVRKSSRVPKKRIFDGDEDMELEPKRRRRKKIESVSEDSQCCIEEEGNEMVGDFEVQSVSVLQGRHKRQWKKKDEPQSPILDGKKELPLTARQRALKCSKEGGDSEPGANMIEFPEGLTHHISKKQRENLSEAEQAIKKEEAARKRRQQSEKHDKETQANAIHKILSQDSSRKKREEKIQKQLREIEQEKQAAAMIPAINSIRWVMGPSGNIVSFSQDVELPTIFSGPCSYPQEREKCAAPLCNNTYKYRDSKTRLPLCSLQCYRAIQPPPSSAPAF